MSLAIFFQPIAITLCDPDNEEVVNYNAFLTSPQTGVYMPVLDYISRRPNSEGHYKVTTIKNQNVLWILTTSLLSQLYWTDASISLLNEPNEHRPQNSEYRMRYQFGLGKRAFETKEFWPPVWYKNNTQANANKRCAEYRWPLTRGASYLSTNECWEKCPVLCRSTCE